MLLAAGIVPLLDRATATLAAWTALALAFALATTFVPALKCLGSGYYYLYNAAFPVALLWGLALSRGEAGWVAWTSLLGALLASAVALAIFYRKLACAKEADEGLDEVLAYLQAQPSGLVMCLPPQLYDLVAYRSGQPVLYGGHGYGFRRLEPVFPRLLLTVGEARVRYGVRYLLTRKGYLPHRFLKELRQEPLYQHGDYVLFSVE